MKCDYILNFITGVAVTTAASTTAESTTDVGTPLVGTTGSIFCKIQL